MRTFVGVKIPVDAEQQLLLAQLQQKLKFENIKWVDLSTLHVTLFFLGDTSDELAKEICKFFTDCISQIPVFNISVYGVGTFGSKGNPRVIWLGLKPSDDLNDIQQMVEQFVVAKGYPVDERGFNPHITIGRIKGEGGRKQVLNVVSEFGHLVHQDVVVDEVILYKSELTPTGATYTKHCSQKLFVE